MKNVPKVWTEFFSQRRHLYNLWRPELKRPRGKGLWKIWGILMPILAFLGFLNIYDIIIVILQKAGQFNKKKSQIFICFLHMYDWYHWGPHLTYSNTEMSSKLFCLRRLENLCYGWTGKSFEVQCYWITFKMILVEWISTKKIFLQVL